MRALVVYESMFGNTEAVARAVAGGLAEHMEVELHEVSQAPLPVPEEVDLLVVGGPTHAFSLSRASTRVDAVRQGASPGQVELGVREWISQLAEGPHPARFAAFDTRVAKLRKLPGSAARKLRRFAEDAGYECAGSESFFVEGTAGPLLAGEQGRASNWGAGLASEVSVRA
jgi:hypothetical protein